MSNAWRTPPTAKHIAPANVPQLTIPALIAWSVAGRMNAARPARKNRTEPSWLTATTHQPRTAGPHPDASVAHVEHGQVPGEEEADAPE